MLIDLRDPTPLTKTEALLMVLNANEHAFNDERWPYRVSCWTALAFDEAEYKIRREAVEEKTGKLGGGHGKRNEAEVGNQSHS